MTVSIVTISFNQARFLEQTIQSVLSQDYSDVQYVVVDAGSTDGSREVIRKYRDRIARIIFEPDRGPADGLNKGMAATTGDILGYVNADDLLLPGTVSRVVEFFRQRPACDVIFGHGYVIDADNRIMRTVYVDPFNLRRFVYGCVTFIQPSMFFRKRAYFDVGGFNVENSTCWDAELMVDFARAGKNIQRIDAFLSAFRLHESSISGSGRLNERYDEDWQRIFTRVMNRAPRAFDLANLLTLRLSKWVLNPRNTVQHLIDVVRQRRPFIER